MKENRSIDKFEELVKAELLKEADNITKEVEANEALKDIQYPKGLDEKVMARIRKVDEERRAYEMLSDEGKEAYRLGKEMMLRRELEIDGEEYDETDDTEEKVVAYRRKKRPWKAYLLVAVVTVMFFAFGMTSIGGRPFILDMMNDGIFGRKLVKIDSAMEGTEEIIEDISEEEKLYQEIEETFGILPARMGYLPEGTRFLEGTIYEEDKKVNLLYQWDEEIIEYRIFLNYGKSSHGYDVEDKIIKEYKMEVQDVLIDVTHHELPEGKIEQVAQFEYESTFYILNATISEAEFEKIVKNFIFF